MAKYVNILFLDTLDCFWEGNYKTNHSVRKHLPFSPFQFEKKGISPISKICIQHTLFKYIN